MDPLDCARRGDFVFFKEASVDVILKSRDEEGDSVLALAARANHIDCCKEICKRCPSLLYHRTSQHGYTALHYAAFNGKPKMIKFLISAGVEADLVRETDIESRGGDKTKHLLIRDENGEMALHKAVYNHKTEAVKVLIEADPDNEMLRVANSSAKDTPLHWAVQRTNVEMVKLLIDADPNFKYEANLNGETPLLMSIRSQTQDTPNIERIRKLLLKMQQGQSLVQTGDVGWTALHHATQKGNFSAIMDIIQFCPGCQELVDNEGRNFLHLAAMFEQVKVVKYILETKNMAAHLLNVQDNDGNTPLHLAVLAGNQTMILWLLYDPRVNKMIKNKKGQAAIDEITFDYDKRKAGVFGAMDRVDQRDIKDQSDFDLVVGALIATVSFTAGITVPGGYISEGSNKGTAVLWGKQSFAAFIISNNLALIISLYAVFSHFCARRFHKEADIIYQLNVATICTLCAIYCMMVAFITGSFAVLADSTWLAIIVCINSCFFFIFSCGPMWRIAMQRRLSSS